jgi:isopenicillin N synthase-like dioxygenase
MPDTIPVIDVAGLAGGDDAALQRLAHEIGQAARGLGFFLVTGHGIPVRQIDDVSAMARAFFALPVAAKEPVSIKRSPHNRGWIGQGGEALDPAKGADLKEAFNIGLDMEADDPAVRAGEPFRGVNLWPDLPGFRATMLGYYDAVWALGRLLHRPVAVDLGLAPDWFEDKLDRPLAILRLLHYPAAGSVAGEVGAGTHTDYGNLTLLHTEDAGSLEVRTRDGRWIAPPAVPGAFIVNIGDCLMRWTNDVYVSTPHRVIHRAAKPRLSIAFFLDPDPDAHVAALPGTGAPKYAPISGAAYLKERLDATYAHRREPA